MTQRPQPHIRWFPFSESRLAARYLTIIIGEMEAYVFDPALQSAVSKRTWRLERKKRGLPLDTIYDDTIKHES